MTIHLGGWGETIDAAGALVNLTALADPLLFRSGDTIRIPDLNSIFMLAAGVGSGGDGYANLIAPSLREIGNLVIQPVNGNGDADAEPDDPPALYDMRTSPLVLRTGENATVEVESDTTAATRFGPYRQGRNGRCGLPTPIL